MMEDNINNDCDGATGDNDDDNDATHKDVDDDGNGATEDYVDNEDCDRTTDDDVNDDGYGGTDDDINNDCEGATDGRHCLDACGGCATKGDARQRHATTGNATTSQRTRCKQEERRQRTRGSERERLCCVSCVAFLATEIIE